VLMAWPTPARFSAEDAAGEAAAALLGDLRGNRLEQALPDSTLVEATTLGLLSGSVFQVVVEPAEGAPLEDAVKAIDGALARLRTLPPAQAELDAAVRRLLRTRLRAQEDPLDRALFLADVVADARVSGDPFTHEQQRCLAVRPEDVRAFAAKYLLPERRVTVFSTPAGGGR